MYSFHFHLGGLIYYKLHYINIFDYWLGTGQGKVQGPWQVPNQNNGFSSQVLQSNMSTTPWPALNRRRNQSPNQNNSQQPMWVQNGSNWVRNSPLPTQPVPVPTMNSKKTPQNVPTTTACNPWQNNNNNRNNNNNKNMVQMNVAGSTTSPKSPISSQNNMNINTNNQNSPVNFLTSPRTQTKNNNRNNINVNLNVPGGMFSSGSTRRDQKNNITINSVNQRDQNKGDVNDDELRDFSETLLSKDVNNAAKYVTINLQKMTSSRSTVDEAPLP